MTDMMDRDNLTLHIRCIRTTRWLWIENAVYDRYAAQLGPEGLGVYVGLARYANNKTGKCWPSMARLATDMGTDLSTIEAALERIVRAGLLHVTQEPGKGTVLTLLDAQAAVPTPPAPPVEVQEEPAPVEEPVVVLAREEQVLRTKQEETKNIVCLVEERGREQHAPARVPDDGTPRWDRPSMPVLVSDRPDEFLAALGLTPETEDYASLLVVAEAELAAEGHNPFYTILPIKQTRMIQVLLRDGVIPTVTTAVA